MNTTAPEENKPLKSCPGCFRVIREGEPVVHASTCMTPDAIIKRRIIERDSIDEAAPRVDSASHDPIETESDYKKIAAMDCVLSAAEVLMTQIKRTMPIGKHQICYSHQSGWNHHDEQYS